MSTERVRIAVDLSPADAAELDAAMAAMPVRVTRSALVREALRRGLRGLVPTRRTRADQSGATPNVRLG